MTSLYLEIALIILTSLVFPIIILVSQGEDHTSGSRIWIKVWELFSGTE